MLKEIFGGFRFSDDIRRTLGDARHEAVRLRHDYVGTEHLLIASTRDPGVAALLEGVGMSAADVRAAITERTSPGAESVALRKLRYRSDARRVLELAITEARRTDAVEVSTRHLFVGLMREEDGIASIVLRELGLTRDEQWMLDRQAVRRRFRVRIDDAAERSIHEQIVAQIGEAVATGEMAEGERLLPVRQLADELGVAPGTVARAYAELERSGVVVTQGTRGTRVAARPRDLVTSANRASELTAKLRPIAVAARNMGADASELRGALDEAMQGIYGQGA